MYGIEPIFWLKLAFLILMLIVAFFIFNRIMGKWLKVNKKMFAFRIHMNERHKKINLTITLIFIPLLIVGSFINTGREAAERISFFEIGFLMMGLIVLTESIQAYMERKYSENKNDYIFTLSQLGFSVLLVVSVIMTNFFGLF